MAEPGRPAHAIRAPRGAALSCRGWPQEAALRMLMNNLDPDVAERWQDLVVYGGSGKAARNWAAFHRIVATLRRLEADETLLVQSGKPVGVFRTHPDAPRVLIANALLVPAWGDWEHFRQYEAMGLTMYGQMTAGSWIYIGTQGILQGTYETFARLRADALRRHAGRAAGAHGRPRRHGGRPAARGHDERGRRPLRGGRPRADRAPAAPRATSTARRTRSTRRSAGPRRRGARARPLSIALHGNAAETHPELARRGRPRRRRHRPDVGPRHAERLRPGRALAGRGRRPAPARCQGVPPARIRVAGRPHAGHARVPASGRRPLRLRQQHPARGRERGRLRLRLSGLRARPSSGRSSAKARARSAGWRSPAIPRTSTRPTGRSWRPSRDDEHLVRWLRLARERVPFQGLPARICWLGYGDRARAGTHLQRPGGVAAASRRPSSSAATTSTRARSPRPTARPSPCATAPTPSPTGRSSTRS